MKNGTAAADGDSDSANLDRSSVAVHGEVDDNGSEDLAEAVEDDTSHPTIRTSDCDIPREDDKDEKPRKVEIPKLSSSSSSSMKRKDDDALVATVKTTCLAAGVAATAAATSPPPTGQGDHNMTKEDTTTPMDTNPDKVKAKVDWNHEQSTASGTSHDATIPSNTTATTTTAVDGSNNYWNSLDTTIEPLPTNHNHNHTVANNGIGGNQTSSSTTPGAIYVRPGGVQCPVATISWSRWLEFEQPQELEEEQVEPPPPEQPLQTSTEEVALQAFLAPDHRSRNGRTRGGNSNNITNDVEASQPSGGSGEGVPGQGGGGSGGGGATITVASPETNVEDVKETPWWSRRYLWVVCIVFMLLVIVMLVLGIAGIFQQQDPTTTSNPDDKDMMMTDTQPTNTTTNTTTQSQSSPTLERIQREGALRCANSSFFFYMDEEKNVRVGFDWLLVRLFCLTLDDWVSFRFGCVLV